MNPLVRGFNVVLACIFEPVMLLIAPNAVGTAHRNNLTSMVNTSSGGIRWVDYFDEGLDRPPSTAEWVDASCGRGDPYMDALRQNKELSPQQWDALKVEDRRKLACEMDLCEKHREGPPTRQIPNPRLWHE
jgi:hypothetical protein